MHEWGYFSKIEFPLAEKNLQTKEYGFKSTENRFPSAGMENLFKSTFLLDEKTAYIGRYI